MRGIGTICRPQEFFRATKGLIMAGARTQQAARLTAHIRREIATETNQRVLKALPAFRADHDLPKKLKRLLEKLANVESGPTQR